MYVHSDKRENVIKVLRNTSVEICGMCKHRVAEVHFQYYVKHPEYGMK